jgi:HlyD family secretion protein
MGSIVHDGRLAHAESRVPQAGTADMNIATFAMKTVIAAGAFVVATWRPPQVDPTFQGWVEANFVFIGADEIGRVESLRVREGDVVAAGAPLFTVDSDLQLAAVRQTEATFANAQQTFNRAQELLKSGTGTKKEFDNARSTLSETEASVSSARTRLTRRNVLAPAGGAIQEVYFRPGEVVPVGRPVVSLLPPGNVKVRFFVPQALLPQIKTGDAIKVKCDGCAPDVVAHVSFISQKAEYTPPVIYSLEERAKLVFLVEARPDQPDLIRVGQPVRVTITGQQGAL